MNDSKPQSIMWLPSTPTDVLLYVLPGALVSAVLWKVISMPLDSWDVFLSTALIAAKKVWDVHWSLALALVLIVTYTAGFFVRHFVVPSWLRRIITRPRWLRRIITRPEPGVKLTCLVKDKRVICEFLARRICADAFPADNKDEKLPGVRDAVEDLTSGGDNGASDSRQVPDCGETCRAKVAKVLTKWFPHDRERRSGYDISRARMSPDRLYSCLEEIRGRYFAQFREEFLPIIERRELADGMAGATMIAVPLLLVPVFRVALCAPTWCPKQWAVNLGLVAVAGFASTIFKLIARSQDTILARNVVRTLAVWW